MLDDWDIKEQETIKTLDDLLKASSKDVEKYFKTAKTSDRNKMLKELNSTGTKPNLFQTMQSAVNKKPASEEAIKDIPSFMFTKFLGSDHRTFQFANILNHYGDVMPIQNQYKMVKMMSPKINFISFTKNFKEEDSDTEILMKHYKCNYKLAQRYKELLGDQLQEVLNKYN